MSSSAAIIDTSPIGIVTEAHGPVTVIACERLPPLRQALRASLDHETCLFEVHQHLDEHHVRAITLHRSNGLRRGMRVYDTGAPLHVPVTPDCLGRLLNAFGEPLDGLSRELGVEIYRLEAWRERALAGMEIGLKARQGEPREDRFLPLQGHRRPA